MSDQRIPDREAAEDAMTRFVLGESNQDETDALMRLLAEKPELREDLADLQRSLALLPYAVAAPPPPHLKARIVRAAGEPTSGRAPRALPRWRFLAAAASLAAAALLVQNVSLRRELQVQREVGGLLQQPNVVLSFTMKGTGANAGAFGSVLLDLDAKKGAVVIHRLEPLPPERVYRLWALIDGQTIPCGEFNASAESAVLSLFPIPVDAYTAPVTRLILTVEPSPAPPRPVGPTVMVGASAS